MSYITWDDSFSVDNAEIDEQHIKWIAIHNTLHETLIEGDTAALQQAAIKTLREMYEYVRYHFAFEEAYLSRINYPGIQAHWRLHKDFDSQIYGYLRDAQNEEMSILNSELVKILKNWLVHHILTEDMKFSPLPGKKPGL